MTRHDFYYIERLVRQAFSTLIAAQILQSKGQPFEWDDVNAYAGEDVLSESNDKWQDFETDSSQHPHFVQLVSHDEYLYALDSMGRVWINGSRGWKLTGDQAPEEVS